MAVVNTKSTLVTNADASPSTMSGVVVSGGRRRSMVATLEAVSGDSIGSTYRMFRVSSQWRIAEIVLYCDAITTCAADVGLYNVPGTGSADGSVVDADAYASAQSLASAITTGTNVAFEARNVDKIANQVWQDAGLTSDSGKQYDLALTLTAAAGSAGTISVELVYVAND